MEDNFKNTVLDLHREIKWKEILHLNEDSKNELAQKLLWVWPSEENLNFIKNIILIHNLRGIISIGCGCGLLEWLIQKHSGMTVVGFEVNEEWWKSRYCNPHFLKLQFPTFPLQKNTLPKDMALLFCYFNDGLAFIDYVNCYEGNVIIIIGPGNGRGTLTNPEPFNPNFGQTKWKLDQFQEVKNTKDFIAVYVRN